MLIIEKRTIIYIFTSIFLIFIFTSCSKNVKNTEAYNVSNANKVINSEEVYNVVKRAFLIEDGYSNDISKHMSQKVFNETNIYNIYDVNDTKYKRPFEVSFSLKEDSQKKINDIIYVDMTYSVSIVDSQNKIVGGSWRIPIKFTIKTVNNTWMIINKYEDP
ncbi:hypothetical protein [Clostridium sp.]|uniref:hypothetical protein n=1 Tax=Clostridium sp. TaxID=1506 RepID=UPI0039EC31E1